MRSCLITSGVLRRPPERFLSICRRCIANLTSTNKVFEEGDVVLLRPKKNVTEDGILTKLRFTKTLHTHRGPLPHSIIVGKRPRDIVQTIKGHEYRVYEPTLAEYVRFTRRLVTPIYPEDANIIVSLLDLHVSPALTPEAVSLPLEILEAGTGHGALTLHLARAIHAANPALPVSPTVNTTEVDGEDVVYLGESVTDLTESNLTSWKQRRGAIIHTLDISAENSKHAQGIVSGFRKGIYAKNVEFHVGDVSAWVTSQLTLRNTSAPFLAHVLLDMPNADLYLKSVAKALHIDGALVIFNPSVTQITKCVEIIREQKLPFLLDQVVELGASASVRQWDIRSVRPRATLKKLEQQPLEEAKRSEDGGMEMSQEDLSQVARDREMDDVSVKRNSDWSMICRPRVGDRVVCGGFVGIWRRMRPVVSTAENT